MIASGIRWYRFSRPEGRLTEALVALAYFRLFETFLTLTMGFGFLMLSTQRALRIRDLWIVLLILAIILIWVLITRFSLTIYTWVKVRLSLYLNRPVLRWSLLKLDKLLVAASAFSQMPARDLLRTMLSGAFSALAGITSGVVLARSLGIPIGLLDMGWIQAVISLASQLPFTMADGLGVREVTIVALLGAFGISSERALALSFLIFTRSILIALMGGAIEAVVTLRNRRLSELDPVSRKPNEY